MLSHSLRALWLPPGGPRSIRKYSDALVRLTVSGRFACSFQSNLHFADKSTIVRYIHIENVTREHDILKITQESMYFLVYTKHVYTL